MQAESGECGRAWMASLGSFAAFLWLLAQESRGEIHSSQELRTGADQPGLAVPGGRTQGLWPQAGNGPSRGMEGVGRHPEGQEESRRLSGECPAEAGPGREGEAAGSPTLEMEKRRQIPWSQQEADPLVSAGLA